MTTENTAEDKKTFLVIQLGEKRELFLVVKKDKNDKDYFKSGPLSAFEGATKEGVKTGAISLSLSVVDAASETGYKNVDVGTIYRKEGKNGPFFDGYVGGVTEVDGTTAGQKFYNLTEIKRDDAGKMVDAVSVTANVRGPKSEEILASLPVIVRPAKESAAEPEKAKLKM